jgi:4-amino-4-deoxy-L-arabinose transferase-like glycosyltransferase
LLYRALKFLTSSLVIVLIALLARLVYLWAYFHAQAGHGSYYQIGEELGSIAASIASGHGFSSPLYTASGPTAWSTPVFPYLLAGIFKVFGAHSLHATFAIRLLNVLFSAATTYPVLLIGRKLFGVTSGAVAGWIWAFLPMAITLPVDWAWDMSLAALLLTTALWMTYALETHGDANTWLIYGALWGFAALVNAAVLCVFPGCLLFALYRRRQLAANWVRPALQVALAFALTISPWIIRNQIVFHGKVLFRSNFGLELWLGNNPDVPDSWTWWLHPLDSAKEHDEFFKLGEVAYMEEKRAAAVQFIKTHPADTARFQFHRFMETWTGYRDPFADIWATKIPLLRAELLMNYTLTMFTFLGLLFAYRRIGALSLPLLNAVVFFPIVYYVCHTGARYRHPIDPLLAILSGYAVVSCAAVLYEWKCSAFAKTRAISPSDSLK